MLCKHRQSPTPDSTSAAPLLSVTYSPTEICMSLAVHQDEPFECVDAPMSIRPCTHRPLAYQSHTGSSLYWTQWVQDVAWYMTALPQPASASHLTWPAWGNHHSPPSSHSCGVTLLPRPEYPSNGYNPEVSTRSQLYGPQHLTSPYSRGISFISTKHPGEECWEMYRKRACKCRRLHLKLHSEKLLFFRCCCQQTSTNLQMKCRRQKLYLHDLKPLPMTAYLRWGQLEPCITCLYGHYLW